MGEPLVATPHLDTYVPERHEPARQLRLVTATPRPETNAAAEGAHDRIATLRSSARRLIELLDNLGEMARTSDLDFEATILELFQEESEQLRQTLELSSQHEKGKSLIRNIERLRIQKGQEPISASDRKWLSDLSELERLNRDVYEAYKRCRKSLEQIRDVALQAYASRWSEYLGGLESVVPLELATAVRTIWDELGADLWAPQATPREESFLLIWDRGKHHLEIEVFPGGTFDWLYRDRVEDAFQAGEDVPVRRIPSPLRAAVRKTRKG